MDAGAQEPAEPGQEPAEPGLSLADAIDDAVAAQLSIDWHQVAANCLEPALNPVPPTGVAMSRRITGFDQHVQGRQARGPHPGPAGRRHDARGLLHLVLPRIQVPQDMNHPWFQGDASDFSVIPVHISAKESIPDSIRLTGDTWKMRDGQEKLIYPFAEWSEVNNHEITIKTLMSFLFLR
jgi:hypothetical protein